jgi:prepilin-type N-terminal cleavage/methylation domain-containing protein
VFGSRGFTIIEVLVALTLSSFVVVLGHRVFSGIIDGSARVGEVRASLDSEMNARRRLTRLIGSLEVGPTEADAFRGEPTSVSFTAWDRDANGWNIRRRLTLQRVESELIASGLDVSAVSLASDVRAMTVDYLLEPGAEARWVKRWSSAATAPLAMRLRLTRVTGADTLLLIIGARG